MASEAGASAPETAGRRRARVAVIGAGAAGLAAARELTLEGHDAVVFEQGAELGGVWVYDADVEDDLTGADANRAKRVHSSVYASLRTNLPREVMGFASFPFTRAFTDDIRRFPGHAEVRAYLDAYADHHRIRNVVRLNTRVVSVTPIETSSASSAEDVDLERWGPRWLVQTEPACVANEASSKMDEDRSTDRSAFDAVVVCNGHYSEPRSPTIPGSDGWPGTQMHSHNYRTPEGDRFSFRGKTVVVLGAMASGEDLSREIASVAKHVTLASRGFVKPSDASFGDFPLDSYPENMSRASGIKELLPETSGVLFEDGSKTHDVDVVLYATGYHVTFPFFAKFHEETFQKEGSDDLVPRAFDNRVAPLFEHVFPPASGPSLSFIGLPWKVVPFPQFEAQARWIAKALSGASMLPDRGTMASRARAAERKDFEEKVEDRHAHRMGDNQFAYNKRLYEYCREDDDENDLLLTSLSWREAMYKATGVRKRAFPTSYRDGPAAPWSDEEALREARREAAALGFESDSREKKSEKERSFSVGNAET